MFGFGKGKNKKDKKKIVALVRLAGVIGKVGFSKGLSLEGLKYLEGISKIKKLDAIVLLINSPGGSPVQSEFIGKRIQKIAGEHKSKPPVISFCEDVAASGGYFIACAGEEIYASTSSIVGSIGVISQGFGFKDAIKKLGIERRVYSQGKNKSVLDPFSDAKKDDIELIKEIQKDVHEGFIAHVKKSRGERIKASDEEVFNGKFWTGSKAHEIGLIDGVGYYEDVLAEKFGDNIEFKEISAPQGFFKKKFGMMADVFFNKIFARVDEELISSRFKI
jgi:signal peptide peptidase SppA